MELMKHAEHDDSWFTEYFLGLSEQVGKNIGQRQLTRPSFMVTPRDCMLAQLCVVVIGMASGYSTTSQLEIINYEIHMDRQYYKYENSDELFLPDAFEIWIEDIWENMHQYPSRIKYKGMIIEERYFLNIPLWYEGTRGSGVTDRMKDTISVGISVKPKDVALHISL